MKLSQYDHPYYMSEGCFFEAGCLQHYESWQDYLHEWSDVDDDMNLLWRWDFIPSDESKEGERIGPFRLDLFYIMQRKGYTYSCHIKEVKPEEEAEIRDYLRKKSKKIAEIWAPFLETKHD
jgi:hypothetical protein